MTITTSRTVCDVTGKYRAGAIVKVGDLRVGDRFSWIPAAWYGPCQLLSISKRICYRNYPVEDHICDLKYDARVVNPPGVSYGVPEGTKVRMLTKRRT